MEVNPVFEKWCLGYSGCDGGDIGSAASRSIWACGIEWGGGHDPEDLQEIIQEDVSAPPGGYEDWQHNLAYIFNWQLMKLLAAMGGQPVTEYKLFAETTAPFVAGGKGYFKMNLFPVAFKNTSHENWRQAFAKLTGFNSKQEYLQWCREFRLPQLKQWSTDGRPEVIICLGKTYLDDFAKAFLDDGQTLEREVIDDRELHWAVNSNGTLVAVLPFMVNRNGLVRNVSIQKFGERIAEIWGK